MKNLLKRLVSEERGQDVIEYALLAAGISIIVIPTVPADRHRSGRGVPANQRRGGQHLAEVGRRRPRPGGAGCHFPDDHGLASPPPPS